MDSLYCFVVVLNSWDAYCVCHFGDLVAQLTEAQNSKSLLSRLLVDDNLNNLIRQWNLSLRTILLMHQLSRSDFSILLFHNAYTYNTKFIT